LVDKQIEASGPYLVTMKVALLKFPAVFQTFDFYISTVNQCPMISLVPMQVADMLFVYGTKKSDPVEQKLPEVELAQVDGKDLTNQCGEIIYDLQFGEDFLELESKTRTLSLYTEDHKFVSPQSYPASLLVSLPKYPSVKAIKIDFEVTIADCRL